MFSNPQEYLKYLKDKHNKPIPGIRDNEFDEITKNQWQKYAKHTGDVELSRADERLNIVLNSQFKDILASQSAEEKERIEQCLAIGSVDTGELTAFIAKGGVNIYCIVLSSGLMMLIHKSIKLIVASILPEEVIYCSGQDPSQFSARDYWLMYEEMVDIYGKTGFPRGALVKFGEKALLVSTPLLHLAESFVICHEIAHLLNNDVEDESEFVEVCNDSRLMKYIEDKDHAKELKADVTGYRLLSNYLNKAFPEMNSKVHMMGIVTIMDVLASIGITESHSHPSPKDRVVNIAESCLPHDEIEFWKGSYSNLGL